MTISEKQVEGVVGLPAQQRYEHFVKQVADLEEVWGLYQNGWAISSDDSASHSLPVWSSPEYAELLRLGEWKTYQPTFVELSVFLEEMLPDLERNSISIAVMYLPSDEGVVVSPQRLAGDIELELEKY